jgi:hypothetical protein
LLFELRDLRRTGSAPGRANSAQKRDACRQPRERIMGRPFPIRTRWYGAAKKPDCPPAWVAHAGLP